MHWPEFLKLREVEKVPTAPDHNHEWQQKLVTYAPPYRQGVGVDAPTADQETLLKVLLGMTTFLFECAVCKESKKEEMLGSQNPELDEMLDKVLLYGPQYLQRDTATFVFQKYSPPAQPMGAVPIR